jgi:hypothetical protein
MARPPCCSSPPHPDRGGARRRREPEAGGVDVAPLPALLRPRPGDGLSAPLWRCPVRVEPGSGASQLLPAGPSDTGTGRTPAPAGRGPQRCLAGPRILVSPTTGPAGLRPGPRQLAGRHPSPSPMAEKGTRRGVLYPRRRREAAQSALLPNGAAAKAGLNRAIHRSCWSTFARRLDDKGEASGVKVRFADPEYTSQQCRRCGHRAEATARAKRSFVASTVAMPTTPTSTRRRTSWPGARPRAHPGTRGKPW